MSDRDAFAERGRALEEEYFRRKDRELIERMRAAAEAEQARKAMGEKSGLTDPALLEELQTLGFTPDTLSLIPLVPILQVAWAEGGVTPAERNLIVSLARNRGIEPGSPADAQLSAWMGERPSDEIFSRAGRLIRAMLDAGSAQTGDLTPDDLVKYCETIAAASGGLFGIGRVSGEERELLAAIAADLKTRHG